MLNSGQSNSPAKRKILIVSGVVFSGLCWYFSNGLNGDFWYLLWLAPVPLLVISLNRSAKISFLLAFIAYLIGRFSWFSYLVTVARWVPAIIFTLLLPLIFAFIILITRKAIKKTNFLISVFAFPVFFTSFEFLVYTFSKDGTAGSIAYSQLNFLPLIQIASLTGILGITFFVTLVPSLMAVGWYYRKEKSKLLSIVIAGIMIIGSVLLFGLFRMNKQEEQNTITVGLVSGDEKIHEISNHPDVEKSIRGAEYYAEKVKNIASMGAQIVVLPERAINITKESDSSIMKILGDAARQKAVTIITGYTNFKNADARNSALVINEAGNVVIDYDKAHLVTGFENQFTPGNKIGLFEYANRQVGVAICKDLDFNNYIRKYGRNKIEFLFVPAWDFVTDDWLHSRMAILRGVENGFSEIRTARQGRLTITDPYGKVEAEANSSKGNSIMLIGRIMPYRIDTFYSHYGDWFGFVNLLATIYFLAMSIRKRKLAHKN